MMTKREKQDKIQAIQDQLYDLYRGEVEAPEDPAVVRAGQLAWEATRLFWYVVAGDEVGVKQKLGFTREALDDLRRSLKDQQDERKSRGRIQ